MSVNPKNIVQSAVAAAEAVGLEKVVKLVEQVPDEALVHVAAILSGAIHSKNPARYLKRIAVAQAAHAVTKKAVNTALSK